MYRLVFMLLTALIASRAFAQASGDTEVPQSCDRACQQKKVDALFKAMDYASAAQHPKASDSTECTAYDGHDVGDVLIDVCRKLKYVRSLPVGTETNFPCPRDTHSLLGRDVQRIRSLWGEPDFVDDEQARKSVTAKIHWTYFIGSPKPGYAGGGFAELSLELDRAGNVTHASCDLAQ